MVDPDGFLSRWSRRKHQVREGKAIEAEPAFEQQQRQAGAASPAPVTPVATGQSPATPLAQADPLSQETPPPPTLDEARLLTPASDFRRFVAPDVAPEVKSTALKKLFADPHFNAMDGLDVYIDDYSKPDPMPAAMARQLASAHFLKLFDEEKKPQPHAEGREVANNPATQTVAQSDTDQPQEPAVAPTQDHADPDLRLQQDDAPGPAGPGTGAE